MSQSTMKFASPLHSFLDVSFFQELARLKLDVLKLQSQEVPLWASLDLKHIPKAINSAPITIDKQSFDTDNVLPKLNNEQLRIEGTITNFNTFEQFKELDKQNFLEEKARKLQNKDINKVVEFHIISFADLKKYKFFYWVCIPCFEPKNLQITVGGPAKITDYTKFQEWFALHPTQWVCLFNGEKDELNEYSVASAKSAKTLIAVSYTHLDVYKRQLVTG